MHPEQEVFLPLFKHHTKYGSSYRQKRNSKIIFFFAIFVIYIRLMLETKLGLVSKTNAKKITFLQ